MKSLVDSVQSSINALCWLAVLFVVLVNDCTVKGQEAQFTNLRTGRISWVIDSGVLPWTGAYYFINGISNPTRLLSVVDSSSGVTLANCKAYNTENHWRRFFWELGQNYLLCNVSDAVATRIPIQHTTNPRSFSVRVLANDGPRCLRDLIVQNERSRKCPPILERNGFQYAAFACGCNATEQEKGYLATTPSSIVFPIFQLTPPTQSAVNNNNPLVNSQLSTVAPMFPSVNISSFVQQKHLTTTTTTSTTTVTPFTTLFSLFTVPVHPVTPCDDMECENNGTCVVNSENEPVCLDACSTMLCMHGAECEVVNNVGVCKCPPGTTGTLCDKPLCDPPCENNGTCIFHFDKPICKCKPEYLGINCNVFNSCVNDSACEMFGTHARCTINEESKSLVSSELVPASYSCECLDENFKWVDCLTLYATSKAMTTQTTIQTSSTTVAAVTVPAVAETSSETTQLFTAPKTDEITTTNYPTTVEPSLIIPFVPDTFTGESQNTLGSTEYETSVESSTMPKSIETIAPFTFTNGHELPKNNTGLFPLSVLPTAVPSTVPELTAESATDQAALETTTILSTISSGDSRSPNVLHSFSNLTHNNIDQSSFSKIESSEIQTTNIEPHTVAVTTEVNTNGAEQIELTTFDHIWEQTTAGWSPEVTLQPHLVWPQTTVHSFWPEVNAAGTTAVSGIDVVTLTENIETSTESAISEVATGAESVDSNSVTLPPWLKQLTTEDTNINGEWITDSNFHIPEHEVTTEVPSPEDVHKNLVTDEMTTEIEPDASTLSTTQVVTETVLHGNHMNRKLGSKGKGASRSSSSWIVAMVAILTLLMLLGAAGLFVLRYVKRSRKLHGKYNPAREENALSSNYSMPMTTVPKEERLI